MTFPLFKYITNDLRILPSNWRSSITNNDEALQWGVPVSCSPEMIDVFLCSPKIVLFCFSCSLIMALFPCFPESFAFPPLLPLTLFLKTPGRALRLNKEPFCSGFPCQDYCSINQKYIHVILPGSCGRFPGLNPISHTSVRAIPSPRFRILL